MSLPWTWFLVRQLIPFVPGPIVSEFGSPFRCAPGSCKSGIESLPPSFLLRRPDHGETAVDRHSRPFRHRQAPEVSVRRRTAFLRWRDPFFSRERPSKITILPFLLRRGRRRLSASVGCWSKLTCQGASWRMGERWCAINLGSGWLRHGVSPRPKSAMAASWSI